MLLILGMFQQQTKQLTKETLITLQEYEQQEKRNILFPNWLGMLALAI